MALRTRFQRHCGLHPHHPAQKAWLLPERATTTLRAPSERVPVSTSQGSPGQQDPCRIWSTGETAALPWACGPRGLWAAERPQPLHQQGQPGQERWELGPFIAILCSHVTPLSPKRPQRGQATSQLDCAFKKVGGCAGGWKMRVFLNTGLEWGSSGLRSHCGWSLSSRSQPVSFPSCWLPAAVFTGV